MYTIKLEKNDVERLVNNYKDYSKDTTGEYLLFRAKSNDVELMIYTNSNKDSFKATVNVDDIDKFMLDNQLDSSKLKDKKVKTKDPDDFINTNVQIGSDEVGFGDFFGPIIIVAAYVDKNALELIKFYGINDSKKITDKKILDIVPKLINKVTYSLLIVDNIKLNELFDKGYNLNQIKSILHNKALNNVYKKKPDCENFFIDEFTSPNNYYKYIAFEENNIKNITFRTHGESAFPSVALASCIARYYFLIKNKETSEKYGVEIPFGASKKVDEFAKEFIDKFGKTEFKNNVKTKFKNYKALLNTL